MRKPFYICLLVVFILTACSGGATAFPPTVTSTPTSAPTTETPVSGGDTDAPPAAHPATTAAPTNPPGCTNSGAFVADVTVPDNANFEASAAVHKVWRIKNTGTCAWNDQYSLIFAKGSQMGAPVSLPLSATQPGDTLDIAVDMAAPGTNGTYRADFEIHTPSGAAIPIDQSTFLWVIITVINATAESGGPSDTGESSEGSVSISSGGSSGIGLATVTCAYTTNQANVNAVILAINAYRAQNGLPAYIINAQLTQAAQAHSADMACNSLFYHNGSNGSTAWSRVAAIGFAASNVTENVYGSYPPLTGQEAVNWWAADQTDVRHNQNLLSLKYNFIGVGYAFFNNFGYYVVDFVTPAQNIQIFE